MNHNGCTRGSLSVVCIAATLSLVSCFLSAAAAEDEQGTNSTTRLVLFLADGGQLIGTPEISSLPIETPYARLTIPLEEISSVNMPSQSSPATIELQNGDKLPGSPSVDSLVLNTDLGPQQVILTDVEYFSVDIAPGSGKLVMDMGDGVGMDFVWVPACIFRMGSSSDEPGSRIDEQPRHQRTIARGFWMGCYEVTQLQWKSVMKPASHRDEDANTPATSISWHNANAFCRRINKRIASENWHSQLLECRLPTEKEWEYACRGTTSGLYFTGDDETALSKAGWYTSNSGNTCRSVGSKEPNAFGLYDMHGNVWEWCEDWYRSGSYSNYVALGTERYRRSGSSSRVKRGGGFDSPAADCRSARRASNWPTHKSKSTGFRVVLSRRRPES